MSDKASDHDANEHVHTYKHLITSCKKDSSKAGTEWERRDEFFCTECLNVKVKVQRDYGAWKPSWWIAPGDVR